MCSHNVSHVHGVVKATKMVMVVELADGTVVEVPGVAQPGTGIAIFAEGVCNQQVVGLHGYQKYQVTKAPNRPKNMVASVPDINAPLWAPVWQKAKAKDLVGIDYPGSPDGVA